MFSTLSRKLVATTVLVVIGLAPSLVAPAYAQTTSPSTSAVAEPSTRTAEVVAASVDETRLAVSNVLASNDASGAWPAVDADLTPKLNSAVAAGGGTVDSEVTSLALRIKIKIKCTISFPPLRIKCTITIIIIIGSAGPANRLPVRVAAKL
ncbi:MAG TPA: hypothetical protein VFC19_21615 [Candidatus Limnocylindrales bacterium]|nr:hypothetical protein [Candidatus Limnocylindrales bacterium]